MRHTPAHTQARQRSGMGIFDRAREALDAAKDKVGDLTGIDADKLVEAAKSVADAGSSLDDAASALREGERK